MKEKLQESDKVKRRQIIGLALGLPSTLLTLTYIAFHLVDNGIIHEIFLVLVPVLVTLNSLFAIYYYAKSKKK